MTERRGGLGGRGGPGRDPGAEGEDLGGMGCGGRRWGRAEGLSRSLGRKEGRDRWVMEPWPLR